MNMGMTMNVCIKCSKPLELPCPCGKCTLTTPCPHCSTCEPDKVSKWNKMNGVKVCEDYINKELGL